MKTHHLIFWFAALPMMAQTRLFTFGVEGGAPAQTPLGQTDSEIPFVLGPKVNIRILPRLSFETGIMFHRLGQGLNTGAFFYPENSVTLVANRDRGRALEVPLLAKYYFLNEGHAWRPFVTAGPTIRRTSLETNHSSSVFSGAPVASFGAQPILNTKTVQWNMDPVFGAGVDFKTGRFHVEPGVQYSYWGAGKNSAVRKNQVGFQLGFRL